MATLTITFRRTAEGETPAQPRDVLLTIKDYCTDAILPGASVLISGPNGYQFSGVASQTGTISLSQLKPGEYSIVTSKAGYLTSNDDAIANDRFTV